MTTETKIARRKLSLLQSAAELSNVSKACKIIGYSRQQFYEIRRNYQMYGAEGLIDRLPGPRGPHPNRVDKVNEKAILDYSLKNPSHGCLKVAQQLALEGVQVSSGGVRGVIGRILCKAIDIEKMGMLKTEQYLKCAIPPFSGGHEIKSVNPISQIENRGFLIYAPFQGPSRKYCRSDKYV